MKRVLVLGCSGSGKSTFSKELGTRTGLPVIHLDSLYWKAGWTPTMETEWNNIIEELINQETYIMDGNYRRTLSQRLQKADTVFYFDFPRYVSLYRAIKRRIQNHGKTRSDMANSCPEKIDKEFIEWIWNFKKRNRPEIIKMLEEVKNEKTVIIFQSIREVKDYLRAI